LQGIGAALLILGTFILVEARRGDGALMLLAMFAMPTFVGLTLLTFHLYSSLGGLQEQQQARHKTLRNPARVGHARKCQASVQLI